VWFSQYREFEDRIKSITDKIIDYNYEQTTVYTAVSGPPGWPGNLYSGRSFRVEWDDDPIAGPMTNFTGLGSVSVQIVPGKIKIAKHLNERFYVRKMRHEITVFSGTLRTIPLVTDATFNLKIRSAFHDPGDPLE